MLPPAAVQVLSGIAGIFVFGATAVGAVVAVPAIILGGLMAVAAGGNALLFLVAPSVALAALATVFIRFGWDLFSQFIKP
jgi:hypothetical protein